MCVFFFYSMCHTKQVDLQCIEPTLSFLNIYLNSGKISEGLFFVDCSIRMFSHFFLLRIALVHARKLATPKSDRECSINVPVYTEGIHA